MSFLLAHLSDAHLGPLPQPKARELVGKRLTGYLNWTRARAHIHDMDVLAAVVADLKAQQPTHIAMTGDIMNIGLAAEFPRARDWLAKLGAADAVSFVPGNHDAYVRASMPYLARTFAAYAQGDDAPAAKAAAYPYLRRRGGVALIGLSSGLPTPPFMASGRLGRAQLEACECLLAATAREGLIRVVMLHHPPHRSGASMRRGLSDADQFAAMMGRVGAELVLHGHNHKLSVAYLDGPDRRVPIVGVASASASMGTPDHRAGYHLISLAGDRLAPRIEICGRGLLPGGRIGSLGEVAV